jgi:hypothetical protein
MLGLRADSAIACLNFRVLLPNVVKTENGPYRTPEWIRWVMRSILMAKMVSSQHVEGGRVCRWPGLLCCVPWGYLSHLCLPTHRLPPFMDLRVCVGWGGCVGGWGWCILSLAGA